MTYIIKVIYWSGTGNTKVMAKLIIEGIEMEGQDIELCKELGRNISQLLKWEATYETEDKHFL